jgi:hypothetical protein
VPIRCGLLPQACLILRILAKAPVAIFPVLFGVADSRVLPRLSLQFYGEERYAKSVVASRRALDLRPGLRRSMEQHLCRRQ